MRSYSTGGMSIGWACGRFHARRCPLLGQQATCNLQQTSTHTPHAAPSSTTPSPPSPSPKHRVIFRWPSTRQLSRDSALPNVQRPHGPTAQAPTPGAAAPVRPLQLQLRACLRGPHPQAPPPPHTCMHACPHRSSQPSALRQALTHGAWWQAGERKQEETAPPSGGARGRPHNPTPIRVCPPPCTPTTHLRCLPA